MGPKEEVLRRRTMEKGVGDLWRRLSCRLRSHKGEGPRESWMGAEPAEYRAQGLIVDFRFNVFKELDDFHWCLLMRYSKISLAFELIGESYRIF